MAETHLLVLSDEANAFARMEAAWRGGGLGTRARRSSDTDSRTRSCLGGSRDGGGRGMCGDLRPTLSRHRDSYDSDLAKNFPSEGRDACAFRSPRHGNDEM